MILLVGEDSDSILYFRTRIEGATALHLPFGIEAYQGRLGGEEAIVATIGVGSRSLSLEAAVPGLDE